MPQKKVTRRQKQYESKSSSTDLESLSTQLTADLRTHIKGICKVEPFTDIWVGLSTSFQRIGNVTRMEHTLPKTSQDDTLWEGEEVALRYILEDGKMNLCLRMLEDYMDAKRKADARGDSLAPDVEDACVAFEQGVGITLLYAWHHLEAVQTTDLPCFIGYAQKVLQEVTDAPLDESRRLLPDGQEFLIVRYLELFFSFADRIGETRFMYRMRRAKVPSLLAKHLSYNASWLKDDIRVSGYKALSLLLGTEDYSTHSDEYFCHDDDDGILASLADDVRALGKRDYDTKKSVRLLSDAIRRAKMRQKK